MRVKNITVFDTTLLGKKHAPILFFDKVTTERRNNEIALKSTVLMKGISPDKVDEEGMTNNLLDHHVILMIDYGDFAPKEEIKVLLETVIITTKKSISNFDTPIQFLMVGKITKWNVNFIK